MSALALSYLAGLLTTLNPCVLPMLPLVLASTATGSRFGPLAFAAGMVASFTVLGLAIATVGIGLGITPDLLRTVAAAMFVALGLVLLVKPLGTRLSLAMAGVATGADRVTAHINVGSSGGAFLVGTLAGALWSPCSGPALGAAVVLAAQAGGLIPAGARMLAFGLGAATILILLAYGSRAAIARRRDALLAASSWLRPIAGAIFIVIGIAVLVGFDKVLESALLDHAPDWLIRFTTQF